MEQTKQEAAIFFRLPGDLDQRLRELAERKERTLSAQLRYLIREAVEREAPQRPEKVAA